MEPDLEPLTNKTVFGFPHQRKREKIVISNLYGRGSLPSNIADEVFSFPTFSMPCELIDPFGLPHFRLVPSTKPQFILLLNGRSTEVESNCSFNIPGQLLNTISRSSNTAASVDLIGIHNKTKTTTNTREHYATQAAV